jgi:hypothetical protein
MYSTRVSRGTFPVAPPRVRVRVLCRLPLSMGALLIYGEDSGKNGKWLVLGLYINLFGPSFVTLPFLYHVGLLHSGRCHDDGIYLFLPPIRLPRSSKEKGASLSAWSKTMADNRKFTQHSKANTMDRVQRYVQETRFGRNR